MSPDKLYTAPASAVRKLQTGSPVTLELTPFVGGAVSDHRKVVCIVVLSPEEVEEKRRQEGLDLALKE